MRWVHFSDDLEFDLDNDLEGIFVYKLTENFPLVERSREWEGRLPIEIECNEKFVEFQTSPVDGNDTYDEYFIPRSAFGKCIWERMD